jgi:MFS family permease
MWRAGHYFNRIYVLAFGVCFWGLMTAIFSGCTTLTQGYFVWAFNGIGLALVVPTGQSLTADYFSEQSRGAAFGALYLTGAVGAMLGTAFATNTGTARFHGRFLLPPTLIAYTTFVTLFPGDHSDANGMEY